MPGQCPGIRQDTTVSDAAIVGYVRIGHEQIITADAGKTAAINGAAINRYKFPENIILSDLEERLVVALVFLILGIPPNGSMGKDAATRTDPGPAGHNRMRHDFDMIVQMNFTVDNGISADRNIISQFYLGPDDRCRMNDIGHI
jgi:hypothetical protein